MPLRLRTAQREMTRTLSQVNTHYDATYHTAGPAKLIAPLD
jgi:hypothetical protein